jgi:putative hydrolase of the HAD superfamily
MMGAGIRVVMFDLDDTVFDHEGARADGFLAHRRANGLGGDDAAELERWIGLEEELYPLWLRGEMSFDEQRRARARAFAAAHGLELGSDAATDAWFAGYLVQYRRGWRLHDDAVPCFDELERRIAGVRFGIVTNGDLDFQTAKLLVIELDVRIEHVIASGDVGVAKPDPRIFAIACERFGVQPAEAAYIGDRLRTDAIGAAEAGLTGVWLDRPGAATADDLEAASTAGAHVIRTLDALPDLLAG